ncbi:putative Late embryogenesis abundant protein, LEA_2 subgroup [Helianthus debilis subsp. tardiflorus]
MPPRPAQPHLNGAFYGPPVQPKNKSYHHPGRGSTCNPITCCCSCICNCIIQLICQILITIAIFAAIIGLIFWFIFRPNAPKFHVDNATLTQFTMSSTNNTLNYNLVVNMTFRNPNRRLGIYYDNIEATTMYSGQRFSTQEVDGFYLGHKKEKYIGPVFKGEQVMVFDGGDRSKYELEKSDDVYKIDLKLKLKISYKVLWMKTPKFKAKYECDLKVPLSYKGKVSYVKFEGTNSNFDWWGRS